MINRASAQMHVWAREYPKAVEGASKALELDSQCAGLRWFLDALEWPPSIRAFFDRHAPDLDYLMHDVGFDFHLEGGALSFTKSGFYGYF